jgi:hypothetical protein
MDEAATGREHWKILLTSGMGFFTDAYDLFIIGVVATMVTKEWHIASYQKTLLSSLALLTSAVGAVVFGHIADKLGRRKIYGYEVLVLAGGALATAFAPGIWWLIGLRAVLGCGIGGDYPVSATIMSEYASKRNRGKMVGLARSPCQSRKAAAPGYIAREKANTTCPAAEITAWVRVRPASEHAGRTRALPSGYPDSGDRPSLTDSAVSGRASAMRGAGRCGQGRLPARACRGARAR